MYDFCLTHLQKAKNALDEIKEISECIYMKGIVDKASELKNNIIDGTYDCDKYKTFVEVLRNCYNEYKEACHEKEDLIFHDLQKTLNICHDIEQKEYKKKEDEEAAKKAEADRKKKEEEDKKKKEEAEKVDIKKKEKVSEEDKIKKTEETNITNQPSPAPSSPPPPNPNKTHDEGKSCCMIM